MDSKGGKRAAASTARDIVFLVASVALILILGVFLLNQFRVISLTGLFTGEGSQGGGAPQESIASTPDSPAAPASENAFPAAAEPGSPAENEKPGVPEEPKGEPNSELPGKVEPPFIDNPEKPVPGQGGGETTKPTTGPAPSEPAPTVLPLPSTEPTAAGEPTAEPTTSPNPTALPSIAPSAEPTAATSPIPSPEVSPSVLASPSPEASISPSPEASASPTPTVSVSPTPQIELNTANETNENATLNIAASPMPTANATLAKFAGVSIEVLGPDSARVSWATDVASDSKVNYGLTRDLELQESDSQQSVLHSILLSSLAAKSPYFLQAVSCNEAGCTSSEVLSFETLKEKKEKKTVFSWNGQKRQDANFPEGFYWTAWEANDCDYEAPQSSLDAESLKGTASIAIRPDSLQMLKSKNFKVSPGTNYRVSFYAKSDLEPLEGASYPEGLRFDFVSMQQFARCGENEAIFFDLWSYYLGRHPANGQGADAFPVEPVVSDEGNGWKKYEFLIPEVEEHATQAAIYFFGLEGFSGKALVEGITVEEDPSSVARKISHGQPRVNLKELRPIKDRLANDEISVEDARQEAIGALREKIGGLPKPLEASRQVGFNAVVRGEFSDDLTRIVFTQAFPDGFSGDLVVDIPLAFADLSPGSFSVTPTGAQAFEGGEGKTRLLFANQVIPTGGVFESSITFQGGLDESMLEGFSSAVDARELLAKGVLGEGTVSQEPNALSGAFTLAQSPLIIGVLLLSGLAVVYALYKKKGDGKGLNGLHLLFLVLASPIVFIAVLGPGASATTLTYNASNFTNLTGYNITRNVDPKLNSSDALTLDFNESTAFWGYIINSTFNTDSNGWTTTVSQLDDSYSNEEVANAGSLPAFSPRIAYISTDTAERQGPTTGSLWLRTGVDSAQEPSNISLNSNYTSLGQGLYLTEDNFTNFTVSMMRNASNSTASVNLAAACIEFRGTFAGTANRRIYVCGSIVQPTGGYAMWNTSTFKYFPMADLNLGFNGSAKSGWRNYSGSIAQFCTAAFSPCSSWIINNVSLVTKLAVQSVGGDRGIHVYFDNVTLFGPKNTVRVAHNSTPTTNVPGGATIDYFNVSLVFNTSLSGRYQLLIYNWTDAAWDLCESGTVTASSSSNTSFFCNKTGASDKYRFPSVIGSDRQIQIMLNKTDYNGTFSNSSLRIDWVKYYIDYRVAAATNYSFNITLNPTGERIMSNATAPPGAMQTNTMNFTSLVVTASNVVPCVIGTTSCQTNAISFFNFTNTASVAANWTMWLNASPGSGLTFKCAPGSSASANAVTISTTETVFSNVTGGIPANGNFSAWCWADFSNVAPGTALRVLLHHNSTQP